MTIGRRPVLALALFAPLTRGATDSIEAKTRKAVDEWAKAQTGLVGPPKIRNAGILLVSIDIVVPKPFKSEADAKANLTQRLRQLLKSLLDNGLKPVDNVTAVVIYAEAPSTNTGETGAKMVYDQGRVEYSPFTDSITYVRRTK